MVNGAAVANGLGFIPIVKDVYDELDRDVHSAERLLEEEYDYLLGIHPEMTGTHCATWGPSAWNSGKCDRETGIYYPDGIPDSNDIPVRRLMDLDYLPRKIGESCLSWSPTTPDYFKNCDMETGIWYPEGVPDFDDQRNLSLPGSSCMTWGPEYSNPSVCDRRTGIYYPDGVPESVDLSFPGVLSLMPARVQPQRMRLRPQGSTPYTRMSTQEIAAEAVKVGAKGIFIPAHFYDFVKASRQNVTPKVVSYYLAYTRPVPQDYRPGECTRPGVYYAFV